MEPSYRRAAAAQGTDPVTIPPDTPMRRLTNAYAKPGVVTWLGVRPARGAPMVVLEAVDIGEAGLSATAARRPANGR